MQTKTNSGVRLRRAPAKPRTGPRYKYPWDVWLGKPGVWRLRYGQQYWCGQLSLICLIRRYAKRRGLRVSVYRESPETLVLTNRGRGRRKK